MQFFIKPLQLKLKVYTESASFHYSCAQKQNYKNCGTVQILMDLTVAAHQEANVHASQIKQRIEWTCKSSSLCYINMV